MVEALHFLRSARASTGADCSIIRMIAVACRGKSDRLRRSVAIVESSAAVVAAPKVSTLNCSSLMVKTLSVGLVGTTNVAGTPDAAPVASGETHTFEGRCQ